MLKNERTDSQLFFSGSFTYMTFFGGLGLKLIRDHVSSTRFTPAWHHSLCTHTLCSTYLTLVQRVNPWFNLNRYSAVCAYFQISAFNGCYVFTGPKNPPCQRIYPDISTNFLTNSFILTISYFLPPFQLRLLTQTRPSFFEIFTPAVWSECFVGSWDIVFFTPQTH